MSFTGTSRLPRGEGSKSVRARNLQRGAGRGLRAMRGHPWVGVCEGAAGSADAQPLASPSALGLQAPGPLSPHSVARTL